ncbi:MAG: hypothetical protein B6D63_00745 [Candidatus Latescibacteria bacterium 4484_7]|nr:MAG: hypothetical protein B6D63_00745 [Candidatus Latescibacteria bacterium 4484_7]
MQISFNTFSSLYVKNLSLDMNARKSDGTKDNNLSNINIQPATVPAEGADQPTVIGPVDTRDAQPEQNETANTGSTDKTHIESFSFTYERYIHIEYNTSMAKPNFGLNVARRHAHEKNALRFMAHLAKKLDQIIDRFAKNADLTEEQRAQLKEVVEDFNAKMKNLIDSLKGAKELSSAKEVKESLKDIFESLASGVKDALNTELKASGNTTPPPLPNALGRVFDKFMHKIEKMIDKTTAIPPDRGFRAVKSISIDIVEFYNITSIKTDRTADKEASTPMVSDDNDSRAVLYA